MPLPQYTQPAAPPPEKPAMEHVTQEQARLTKSLTKFGRRIGVHSGKGGVGKTMLACSLARLLAAEGDAVALIDADVDCPNVPIVLNHPERMIINDAGLLQPIRIPAIENVEVVSTGFLQDENEPLIVRGPIKHRILTDFVEKVAWSPADTLVVDFPPGTSDVPLSAMQFLDLHGIIIITTPGRASLADATRAVSMARKLGVPVLGLVANMESEALGFVPESFARELGVPLLGSIPLSASVRVAIERGENPLATHEHAALAQALITVVRTSGAE